MDITEKRLLAAVVASGGQIVISEEHKAESNFKRLDVAHNPKTGDTVLTAINNDNYGLCQFCHSRIIERERRLGGNDRCENGHVYPSGR